MNILDARTQPASTQNGICYPCQLTALVTAMTYEMRLANPMLDRELTQEKVRDFIRTQMQDRRCREHYMEPGVGRAGLDHMPFEDDYKNPLEDERKGLE